MLELGDRYVGRADQRVALLERDHEDDPVVLVLQDVGVVLRVHARYDDVAALHVADVLLRRRCAQRVADHLDPRPADVGDRPRGQPRCARPPHRRASRATGRPRACAPTSFVRTRMSAPCSRADISFASDEPRVVDVRVGVDEALAKPGFRPAPHFDVLRSTPNEPGSVTRRREVVVHEEPGADHPRRPQVRLVRQHELQRLHEVRRLAQHDLALRQRFAHEPELVVLEVAETAVDQLGAPLRGGCGDVVLSRRPARRARGRRRRGRCPHR